MAPLKKAPDWPAFDEAPFLLRRTLVMTKLERPSNQFEIFIGRSIAMCAHPFAAWRTQSKTRRALILLVYFATSYAVTLGVLASGLRV